MKGLLRPFSELFEQNEDFQKALVSWDNAVKSKELQFLNDALLMIRAQMSLDMLSASHTKLSEKEKDVVQRTYYNINQMIAFLMDPYKWVSKQFRWKQNLTNLMGKEKPNRKEGQHGR